MIKAPLAAIALMAAGATAAFGDCQGRLDRTLDVMRSRPLLKEEHATALMWLRMDAEKAEAAGDEADCLRTVTVIEGLLGLSDGRKEPPSSPAPNGIPEQ